MKATGREEKIEDNLESNSLEYRNAFKIQVAVVRSGTFLDMSLLFLRFEV